MLLYAILPGRDTADADVDEGEKRRPAHFHTARSRKEADAS